MKDLGKRLYLNHQKWLQKTMIMVLTGFFGICRETLNIYAPIKRKYLRGNHSPFMDNEKNNIKKHIPKE